MRRVTHVLVLVAALAMIAGPAIGAEIAKPSFEAARVQWDAQVPYESLVLTVSTPGGKVFRQEVASGQTPEFDLSSAEGAVDGAYTWELRLIPRIDAEVRSALADSRRSGDDVAVERLRAEGKLPAERVQSGSFRVQAGSVVATDETEKPGGVKNAKGAMNNVTAADQVIADDLIVQGSACVGFDCINNESFGFDTIRLKENNTRIKFEDTSVGSFPSTDWQLTANDSASGGQNKFSIEDVTAGRVPFTVEGSATTNSLYVDSAGRVGFRTSTPVLDLHVATSNTPGMRLEQTSAGGFTAQTWDIAGNEANFFIRDVTGGSRLPFRIRPGAPSSSIDINASGNVGIGTASPSAPLHISRSDATAKLLVEEKNGTAALRNIMTLANNGGVQFLLDRTDAGQNDWQISNFGATFAISVPGAATNQMLLNANGNMTISGTTYNVGSSRSLKENFVPVDNRMILQRVVDMPLTEWNAKTAPDQRHIGPVAEEWWATFGLGSDDKHVSLTDVGGVALAAIKGLNQVVSEKDSVISRLEQTVGTLQQQNSALEARLATIERLLAAPEK